MDGVAREIVRQQPAGVRMTTTFTADRAEAVAASLQKRPPELGDR